MGPHQAMPQRAQDRFSQASLFHTQLGRYLSALRRRWWILLLSLTLIGGPAVFYAAVKGPTFQSQALMWVASRLNLTGGGVYAEEVTSYVATQAALIKSPNIQLRAFEKVRARFAKLLQAKGTSPGSDSPFELMVRNSTKNSVLELRATGPAPEPTRAFLDAVMEEYLDFKKHDLHRVASSAVVGISNQTYEVELQLQQHQRQIGAFQTNNNVPYLIEHTTSAGGHLARLGAVLSDLRTEKHVLELLTPEQFSSPARAAIGAIADTSGLGRRAPESAGPPDVASQFFYQALQQLQLLKAKREEFAQVLRTNHSKMMKFQQEITGLEQLLKTLKEEGALQTRAQMTNRMKSLELQIENVESQYRAWETNAAEASGKLAEFDRMKQDMQRSQALYDRLLGLLQTVDLNNNLDQEPLAPLAPASPARETRSRVQVAAAGLFLSILVGLGAFLILELLDDRFTSVRELSLHLPVEVIGQIPETRRIPGNRNQRLLPAPDAQPAFAESFRNLRSSLLFMSGQDVAPKVVLVTSAIPQEGKTTVSSNLAETMALSGSRVLLVDADFRRGTVHRVFGVRRKPGLLEVLGEGFSLAQAIVSTGQPNLFILPAGEAANCSSDVLLRYRVDRLLQALARMYDHVVIDSAPVLATDDAACLGPYTDGAFLVVRAAYTSSRMTQEACERLQRRNVKLLGLIYNYAPSSTDYYCQYSRDYHRGNGPEAMPKMAEQIALVEEEKSAGQG